MLDVELCIPSRDGRLDDDVLTRVKLAYAHAARSGVKLDTDLVVAKDSYSVVTARNRGVAGFLSRKRSHLLFLDDDVLLPPQTFVELDRAATKFAGVICGCVPSIRIEHGFGLTTPYVQVRPVGAKSWLGTWPKEATEAEACGGGCMLIPRAVFEAIEFPWFRWPEHYTEGIGINAI